MYSILNTVVRKPTKIDSLKTLLKTDKEDTNKVNHLDHLIWECEMTGDYEKGLSYGDEALKLALKLNFKKGIAEVINDMGSIYSYQANYPKALDCFLKALKMDEELGNKKGIVADLCNIGLVYNDQSDYSKA